MCVYVYIKTVTEAGTELYENTVHTTPCGKTTHLSTVHTGSSWFSMSEEGVTAAVNYSPQSLPTKFKKSFSELSEAQEEM